MFLIISNPEYEPWIFIFLNFFLNYLIIYWFINFSSFICLLKSFLKLDITESVIQPPVSHTTIKGFEIFSEFST